MNSSDVKHPHTPKDVFPFHSVQLTIPLSALTPDTHLRADEGAAIATLESINAAHAGTDGDHPSFTAALAEITAGAKAGHWMWYGFPTLAALRTTSPHATKFQFPSSVTVHMLFDQAPGAASQPLLANIVEITTAACMQLEAGVAPTTLFGSEVDVAKFIEAMTLYALTTAAVRLARPDANLLADELALWCRALRSVDTDGSTGTLDSGTVQIAVREMVQASLCPRIGGTPFTATTTLLSDLAACPTADAIQAIAGA